MRFVISLFGNSLLVYFRAVGAVGEPRQAGDCLLNILMFQAGYMFERHIPPNIGWHRDEFIGNPIMNLSYAQINSQLAELRRRYYALYGPPG